MTQEEMARPLPKRERILVAINGSKCEEKNIDLTVLGTHGRTGVKD